MGSKHPLEHLCPRRPWHLSGSARRYPRHPRPNNPDTRCSDGRALDAVREGERHEGSCVWRNIKSLTSQVASHPSSPMACLLPGLHHLILNPGGVWRGLLRRRRDPSICLAPLSLATTHPFAADVAGGLSRPCCLAHIARLLIRLNAQPPYLHGVRIS